MAARRSTEGDSPVPYALEAAALPPAMREALWDSFEGTRPSKPTVKALEAALDDTDATRRLLLGFPAYALLVLEAICEARGTIERRDLDVALTSQGLDSKAVLLGVDYVVGHGLALSDGLSPYHRITLIAPRARAVAELVLGLSSPAELPPEPPASADVLDHERNVMAVATLTGHRKVKWTLDGLPNKTSLKAFARGLGSDEARIESLLLDAWKSGLIVEDEEGPVEPDGQALHRAALHGFSRVPESLLGTVDAHLPETGWVTARTLLRSVRPFGIVTVRDLKARCSAHFVFREHGGHLFVGRPTRPSLRTGDGHVTPSFEVMLGPGAHPEVAVVVGLFAELVRLDRVLTFKISEASVLAGLRSGRTVDEFLDALAATGRHGVPENVAFTVKGFAARVSTIRAAWALHVPPSAVEKLQQELGAAFLGNPAPGLVLASSLISEADVALAMAAAGLKPLGVRDQEPASEGPRRDPPASRLSTAPDAELRARVDAERKTAFAASLQALGEPGARWRLQSALRGKDASIPEPVGTDADTTRIVPGPHFERELRKLVKDEAVVVLGAHAGPEIEVYNVALENLLRRGNEFVLLAEDLDADENHAFPLSRIAWVDVAEFEPEDLDDIFGHSRS